MPAPRLVTIAAMAAVAAAASGCVQQVAPTPLPQATPSWSCTPVASGTPYACYENQYQQAAAQNKLYDEAEAVFRRFNAEQERIYRAGGVGEPTPVLLSTASGKALESVMATYRNLLADGTRLTDGRFAVAWVHRLPDLVKDGSVATLEACSDISEAIMRSRGADPRKIGQDTDERYYFATVDGLLKVIRIEHKWVEAC